MMDATATAENLPASAPETVVCAVMVTHCTGTGVLQSVPPLLAQAAHLVIVDNCSDAATQQALEQLQQHYKGRIEVLLRDSNNLAAAQNDGIRRALELGYGWVLLMDDDSLPAANMVEQLQNAGKTLSNPENIGIYAPRLTDVCSGREAHYPQATGRFRCRRAAFEGKPVLDHILGVVASGSLIPAEVFRKAGLMDESLCIDYVDKEFCLRVVRAGYRIVAVRDAVLRHRLGQCQDHSLLGFTVTTTNHSPERCYYIYRNRIRSWRKHGGAVPAFVFYDLLAMGYDMLRLICFEQQKGAKIRAIGRGFRDALTGANAATAAGHLWRRGIYR